MYFYANANISLTIRSNYVVTNIICLRRNSERTYHLLVEMLRPILNSEIITLMYMSNISLFSIHDKYISYFSALELKL